MRRLTGKLGFSAAALIVGLWAQALAGVQTPAAGNPAEKTFLAKCGLCHGKTGKGNPAMAKAFKVSPAAMDLTDEEAKALSDKKLSSLILKGKGKMPAFAGKLKDNEIAGLVAFIRGLGASNKSAPVAGQP